MSLARARALAVIGALALVALVTVVWAIVTDDQTASQADQCATVRLEVPRPEQVRIRIYNGTDQSGLANTVKNQLTKRGFTVIDVGNDPQNEVVNDPALIRYGPNGAGAAYLMQAHIRGSQVVDDSRSDATIDVVLGADWEKLTPDDQVDTELRRLEPPSSSPAPSGC